jgi:hypothetical protein
MVHSLAEPLDEAAQAARRADRELDRVAWNLPRSRQEIVSHGAHGAGLDWDRFRDLYYPDTRRHDFDAIVAYGAYKRSLPDGPPPAGNPISAGALSLAEWEDEGGTAP